MDNHISRLKELTVELGKHCRYEGIGGLIFAGKVFKEEHKRILLAVKHGSDKLVLKVLWQLLVEFILKEVVPSGTPDKALHVLKADSDDFSAEELFGSHLANVVKVLFHRSFCLLNDLVDSLKLLVGEDLVCDRRE